MARPNVLILMSDEHRFDLAGFAGNKIVRTPTLDKLATDGVFFDNAYTPSPVCVPGRQCIMAGQLPTNCNCPGWYDLDPGYSTFARHFSRYAYHTVCAGKLHHIGNDQMQGWLHRIGDEARISPAYIEGKDAASFKTFGRPFAEFKWSDAKEIRRAGGAVSFGQRMDTYSVLGACNFIDQWFLSSDYDRERGNYQPLMLKVSLLQPHYPYVADPALFDYYLNRVEPFNDEELFEHPFLSERAIRVGVDVTHRELRRATAAYYAMVETADRHFATVLEALERVGQNLDDWVIVYMSDHGEMLGEHGVWEKQKFFEGSVCVPFLIRHPRGFGHRRVPQNVSLIDLYPTLCDLTGIPTPPKIDGCSLLNLINGETEAWDNEVVSMFSKSNQPLLTEERMAWEASDIHQYGGMNLMIKRDHLKYHYYGESIPEVLFDLERDHSESANLLNDPRYAAAVRRFRLRRGELGFGPKE